MQVTLLAPVYRNCGHLLSLLAVHVGGVEDRGSNFEKDRLLAGSFFLLFCQLWVSKYLLARPAERRDRLGVHR